VSADRRYVASLIGKPRQVLGRDQIRSNGCVGEHDAFFCRFAGAGSWLSRLGVSRLALKVAQNFDAIQHRLVLSSNNFGGPKPLQPVGNIGFTVASKKSIFLNSNLSSPHRDFKFPT
jgi:hypothetical protein